MYREPPREDPSQNHTEEGSSPVSLEHPAEQPPAVPDQYTAPAPDGGAPRPPRNNSLRQALSRAAERRTARRLARETRLEQRRTARREKRIARARERARIRAEKARKRAERARKRAELRLMRIHPHQGRAPKRSDAVDQYGNFAGSVRKGVWTSRDGTPNGTFVKEEEGVFLRLDGRRVGYLDQHRDVRTLSHEYVASLRFKVFSVPFTFLWFAVIFLFVISVAIGFRFFVVSERLGLDLPDNYTISAGSDGGWELNIDHPVRFTDEEGEDFEYIAPGWEGGYSFSVSNVMPSRATCTFTFDEQNEMGIDMCFRLTQDGVFVTSEEYAAPDELTFDEIVIEPGETSEFVLYWRWEHNDENDTIVGENGAEYALILKMHGTAE